MTNTVESGATPLGTDGVIKATVPQPNAHTRVLIRYFAGARAAAGVAEEHIVLSAGRHSVADALAAVRALRGPGLGRVLPGCSFLLDGVAVRDHATTVPDGGSIDVLPPFAGG